MFAIARGFGQQSPDAKTAVTLSVICASNFVRRTHTRDRGAATSSSGVDAAVTEGSPRLLKVITIFSLAASAIICQKFRSRKLRDDINRVKSLRKYGVENESVIFIFEKLLI